jgi:hypothetical protein
MHHPTRNVQLCDKLQTARAPCYVQLCDKVQTTRTPCYTHAVAMQTGGDRTPSSRACAGELRGRCGRSCRRRHLQRLQRNPASAAHHGEGTAIICARHLDSISAAISADGRALVSMQLVALYWFVSGWDNGSPNGPTTSTTQTLSIELELPSGMTRLRLARQPMPPQRLAQGALRDDRKSLQRSASLSASEPLRDCYRTLDIRSHVLAVHVGAGARRDRFSTIDQRGRRCLRERAHGLGE